MSARRPQDLQLTSWDDDIAKHLEPIASIPKPPPLQLLFFANTFPLAFHYSLALRYAKQPTEMIKQLIQFGGWKEKEMDGKNKLIRYTNDHKPATAWRENVRVTTFKPMWAFAPLTLYTARVWHSLVTEKTAPLKERIPYLQEFLRKCAAEARIDRVWIYAELQELGEYLKAFFSSDQGLPDPIIFVSTNPSGDARLPLLEVASSEPNILRLFIYGGSLSSYLLGKENRYLPLRLSESNADDTKMNLFISCPSDFAGALRDYHLALYNSTSYDLYKPANHNWSQEKSPCTPFFTVYRSYNELAWLLQHRSHFVNAWRFAECLSDHHQNPTE